MAASLGDLIQIIDEQTYLGQKLMNVYYYRITSLTGLLDPYPEVLADWFIDTILPPVRAIQNNLLTHDRVEVRNLSNNLDFHDEPLALAGLISTAGTAALPSWMSVNFKLIRESLATRNGSKRFAGLTEAYSSSNGYDMGTTDTENLEAALALDIVLGIVTVAEPVIVRRPIVPPVGTGYTYASIGSAQYTTYGTQNTRKP